MNKLNGGSLFYALAVSILIGMLTGSVILAEYYHRCLLHNNLIREEVIRNAESGIIYFCTSEDMDVSETVDVDLFNRGKDSVLLQRKSWGVYDVCISTAHTGSIIAERIAMIGTYSAKENDFSLWLADMDRPVFVTGTTQINGKCYLPKAGIERAYIEGKSYSGRNLVYGTIELSERFIPHYVGERMNELEQLFTISSLESDTLVEWSSVAHGDEIVRSFSEKRLVISSDSPIHLSGQHLSGQIVLCSATSIIVDKTCTLQNIIITAPRIVIENSVEGYFQAFARDSLIVRSDVQLGYPTALGIVPVSGAIEQAALFVDRNTYIGGEIFLATDATDYKHQGSVIIQPESTIEGSVYCAGSVDLKGEVLGSVSCQKFILKTNSATYENHLMDAVIDCSQRSEFWLGSLLFNKSETTHVIQWLN